MLVNPTSEAGALIVTISAADGTPAASIALDVKLWLPSDMSAVFRLQETIANYRCGTDLLTGVRNDDCAVGLGGSLQYEVIERRRTADRPDVWIAMAGVAGPCASIVIASADDGALV
jgi:hypothetical protein